MNLIGAAQRNPLINSMVKALRVHQVVDFILSRYPLKRLTKKGLCYHVDSVASLVVANELFRTNVYQQAIATTQPKTFIDLGGNVGYFPLLIADQAGGAVKGIVVEPNPELHVHIERHLRTNELRDVYLRKGVVGSASTVAGQVSFYLNPSHIASGLSANFNPRVAVGGKIREIKVDAIDLLGEWTRLFPSLRIDMLKVDIEGAELPFLQDNPGVLRLCDHVLIEWHKWVCDLPMVTDALTAAGFKLLTVLHEDSHAGTAFFKR